MSQLTQSWYDMLHGALDRIDGTEWLTSRLIVDLEPEQCPTAYHILIYWIPRNTDTLRAKDFHPGIWYSWNSCKQRHWSAKLTKTKAVLQGGTKQRATEYCESKEVANLHLPITLPNDDNFVKFIQCETRQWVCNEVIIKDHTTTLTWHYSCEIHRTFKD